MTLKPTRLTLSPYEWDYLPCMKEGYPDKIRISLEGRKQEMATKETINDVYSTAENEILKHQNQVEADFCYLLSPHANTESVLWKWVPESFWESPESNCPGFTGECSESPATSVAFPYRLEGPAGHCHQLCHVILCLPGISTCLQSPCSVDSSNAGRMFFSLLGRQ